MNIILKIDNVLRKVSAGLSFAGAIWIVLIMLIITYDVVVKNFFNSSFVGAAEIVRNSIVGIAFFMVPWATAQLGHVRTTIIVDRVKPMAARVLNIISYTVGFALFVAIIISGWEPFINAIVNHEYELTGGFNWPNWPVKGIIILGAGLSAWSCGVYVLKQIAGIDVQDQEDETQGGEVANE